LSYQKLLDGAELDRDVHQEAVVDSLQRLHGDLEKYHPPVVGEKPNPLTKLIFGTDKRLKGKKKPPQGVYIWGTVGGGKTMESGA
jgi:protein AFG1